MDHAKLSPSSAERWMTCPASVRLSEGIEERQGVNGHAQYGSAAHKVAELCLVNDQLASDYLGWFYRSDTDELKETILDHEEDATPALLCGVNDEMVQGVQEYLDYVHSIEGQELLVEQKFDLSRWVTGGFGTSDAIVLTNDTCYVIDLKFGKGIKVHAEENKQAMMYALGALEEYDLMYGFTRYKLVIVQPRLDHISEWEITEEELLDFGADVKDAVKIVESEDPHYKPSEKACQWCKAKPVCPALKDHAMAVARADFDVMEKPMDRATVGLTTLSNDEIGELLPYLDNVTKWAKSVKEYATDQLNQGKQIKGYKLVEGRGSRRWINPEEAEKKLKAARKIKADQIYTKKLITAPAAEKILGKNHELMSDKFVEKPEGKPTLAVESDKRPALKSALEEDYATDDYDI